MFVTERNDVSPSPIDAGFVRPNTIIELIHREPDVFERLVWPENEINPISFEIACLLLILKFFVCPQLIIRGDDCEFGHAPRQVSLKFLKMRNYRLPSALNHLHAFPV